MGEATGEAEGTGLRVAFDRRLKLEGGRAGRLPSPRPPSLDPRRAAAEPTTRRAGSGRAE